jgi:hypothetical protein
MLSFIPTDDLPTTQGVYNKDGTNRNCVMNLLEPLCGLEHPINYGGGGVPVIESTNRYLKSYTGGGTNILCTFLVHYKEWLPPEVSTTGFTVFFGFRVLARSATGLSGCLIGQYNTTNVLRLTTLDTFPTTVNQDYYLELRVTVPVNEGPYVDIWVDGLRQPRMVSQNSVVNTNLRSGTILIGLPTGGLIWKSPGSANASHVKDIYIGNDQYPNPLKKRLGPIHVKSHYFHVDPSSDQWVGETEDGLPADRDEILSEPITDMQLPWNNVVRLEEGNQPLTLTVNDNTLDDNKRYVGMQVNYHGTINGDLSKHMKVSAQCPGVMNDTQDADFGHSKWMGVAFRPHVTKSTGIDTLTADDLRSTVVTFTPSDE